MRFSLACAGVVFAFALAYSNSLRSPFHFDDDHVVGRNPHVRALSSIPKFFTDARTFSVLPQNATYRPLVSVTLAVDHALGGARSPVPFHLSQLGMFALVGVLLFFVTRNLLAASAGAAGGAHEGWHRWAALLAAALFCLHTANTQPANYISARSELLCAIGVLASLLVYLRAPRLRPTQLYLVPMVVGALAKTPAVIAAPLALAWTLLAERDRVRPLRAILFSLPAFVVAAGTFLFIEGMNPAGQTYGGGSRLEYGWTQAAMWLRYVRLFFVPSGLTADTDLRLLPSPWTIEVAAGVVAFVGSLVLAGWLSRTPRWRAAALGIVWFWLGILPTSSIFPLAEVTNDHRMFLGYLGLCVTFGTLVVERLHALGASRPRLIQVGAAACVALLVAHAVGTHLRNRVWQSEEALWADVTQKSPLNGRGWMNYALTQMSKGELERARQLFDHAAKLTPNYGVLEVNRGIVHGALGNAAEAERHFLRARQLSPNQAAAHYFYARWLVDQGRAAEAEGLLAQAVALDFGDPAPRRLRLWLAAARGDAESQKTLAQALLSLGPDAEAQALLEGRHPWLAGEDAKLFVAAGLKDTAARRHLQAAVSYRAALARDPKNGDAWNNLGWSLLQLGYPKEALPHFERAVTLMGGSELARNNVLEAQARIARGELQQASALAREGRLDEAHQRLWPLVVAHPEWAVARAELGMVLAAQSRCAEANLELGRALKGVPETPQMRAALERCSAAPQGPAGR